MPLMQLMHSQMWIGCGTQSTSSKVLPHYALQRGTPAAVATWEAWVGRICAAAATSLWTAWPRKRGGGQDAVPRRPTQAGIRLCPSSLANFGQHLCCWLACAEPRASSLRTNHAPIIEIRRTSMLAALFVASCQTFTPVPRPAPQPTRAPTPFVELGRDALLKSAPAVAALLPSAAHASLKSDIAAQMGPAADFAPAIGTALFLGLFALDAGVFSGKQSLGDALSPASVKAPPPSTEDTPVDAEAAPAATDAE